jgi:hypothetical protein
MITPPAAPTAPDHSVPSKVSPAVGWLVFACGLLAIAIVNIEGPLYEAGRSMTSFNFASSAGAAEIKAAWGPPLVARAKISLAVDCFFIIAYVSALSLAIRALAPAGPSKWAKIVSVVRALVILGGVADLVENGIALWNLRVPSESFVSSAVPTSVKFVCFALGVLTIVILGIARAAVWENGIGSLARYGYFLRVPIIVLTAMIGLALADTVSAGFAKLSRGIFAVESWHELLIGSFIALMLSWSAMIVSRIILAYASERFGEKVPRALVVNSRIEWGTLAIWALPGIVPIARMIAVGEFWTAGWRIVIAALGIPFAILALFLADSIRLHEDPPGMVSDHAFVLPFKWTAQERKQPWIASRAWFKKVFGFFGVGFVTNGRVRSGHILATAVVFILGIVYVISGYALRPSGNWIRYVPVLYFLVLLASLLLWIGGFLSFWGDRYRLPVLLVSLATMSLLNLLLDSDHYFKTVNLAGPSLAIRSLTPPQIYEGWRQRHDDNAPIVVVTAAGGGIQAAAWTTKVLTELEAETDTCPAQFRDSLLLISAVSGGSVGTMYYADSYIDSASDDDVRHLAMQSSLREVAWGIAYYDFWRPIRPTAIDRATAMEEAWSRYWQGHQWHEWSGSKRTLSDWKDAVTEHDQPAVILNSTIVETGERFLLTNFAVDPRQTGLRDYGAASWTFAHKFPGCNLNITTAARLSSTFPFVSPVAQAAGCEGPQRFHFADGGYYDNFGVSSAIDWLRMAGVNKETLGKHKLIWIQVLSFPQSSQFIPTDPSYKNRWGWALQAVAPITTMYEVRDAGQHERDGIELKHLKEQLGPDQLEEHQFVYHGNNPPLSWHMLPSQQAAIDVGWKNWQLNPNRSTDVDRVRTAFGCRAAGGGSNVGQKSN